LDNCRAALFMARTCRKNKMFATEPCRDERYQTGSEADPWNICGEGFDPFRRKSPKPILIDDVGKNERGSNGDKDARHELHPHTGKAMREFSNHACLKSRQI
jgi:hypothetical protein